MKEKIKKFPEVLLYGLFFSVAWLALFPSLETITRYREPIFRLTYPDSLTLMACVISASLAGLILSLRMQGLRKVSFSNAWIFWFSFLMWALISAFLSGGGLNSLAWWTGIFSIFHFAFLASSSEGEREKLARGLVISLAVFSAFIGLLLYIKVKRPELYRWSLKVVLPPGAGALFFLTLSFFLHRFLVERDAFSFVGAVVSSAGAGLTGNIAVYLYIPLLAVALYHTFRERKSFIPKLVMLFLSCSLLLVSAFYSGKYHLTNPVDTSASRQTLTQMWVHEMKTQEYAPMLGAPLLGSGPGLYSTGFIRHASFSVKKISHILKLPLHKMRPLSTAALIGGETGIVGFLLFFAPFIFFTVEALRRNEPHRTIYPLGVILSAFFIKGGADVRVLYGIILTGALFSDYLKGNLKCAFEGRWILPFILSMGMAGSTIGLTYRYVRGTLRSERAIKVESFRRAGELKGLNEAWLTYPLSPDIIFQFASAIERYEGWEKAKPLAKKVLSLFPDHLPALSILAECERRLGNKDAFFQYQERIVTLDPFNNFEVIKFLRALLSAGLKEKARGVAKKIMKVNPELRGIMLRNEDLRGLINEEY